MRRCVQQQDGYQVVMLEPVFIVRWKVVLVLVLGRVFG